MSVYLLEAVGAERVKIGFSNTPDSRVVSIATASAFPIEKLAVREGCRSLEKAMHNALKERRIKGEWFAKFDGVVDWFNAFEAPAVALGGSAPSVGGRVHTAIVRSIGAEALAEMLGLSINTVLAWAQRDSIPGEVWWTLHERGLADLETLAGHAAANPRKRPTGIAA